VLALEASQIGGEGLAQPNFDRVFDDREAILLDLLQVRRDALGVDGGSSRERESAGDGAAESSRGAGSP
jgi:hypothetical protein